MDEENNTAKRQKFEVLKCIICGQNESAGRLNFLKDKESWKTLQKAAEVRQFQPILDIVAPDIVPELHYHKTCRSKFTNKKTLMKIVADREKNVTDEVAPEVLQAEKKIFLREGKKGAKTRIYEKICIFCEKDKYCKKTKTREPLSQAIQLRSDKTLREIATERQDVKLLSWTSRDIVAAEAHYHVSCYKGYTRHKPERVKKIDPYLETEKKAFDELYNFIRQDICQNPRLVLLLSIREKLIKIMTDLGVEEVTMSTYNKLRYNLESNFESSLHFMNIENRTYVYPDNLTFVLLAEQYVNLGKRLANEDSRKDVKEQEIVKVAVYLRDEIKKHDYPNQSWPVYPERLHLPYACMPKNVRLFYENLLGGRNRLSPHRIRLSWSLVQDVIYNVSSGKINTPKHILLPWAVKSLTGNVELIKMLNKFGHGCSYTKLEEIDTALCLEKLESAKENDVVLPSKLQVGIPTILAFDNIDRQEEVLSGAGTSHRVNGIAVQSKSSTCLPLVENKMVRSKRPPRTIPPNFTNLPIYLEKKKSSPSELFTNDQFFSNEVFLKAKESNFIWIRARHIKSSNQTVSSWTGFNILIRNDKDVEADIIEYLPTINAPATDMNTVQEILRQSNAIKAELELKNIVVVLDQALFAKVTQIAWNEPEKYNSVVFMMGNFHTMCNLLSMIGKVFGETGLRDLAVESEVIAEGSIKKVLEGKHYNRAVRFHKLMYEALIRLIWKDFAIWMKKNYPLLSKSMENFYSLLGKMVEEIDNASYKTVYESASAKEIWQYFNVYLDFLRKDNGSLSAFWMLYIDMVEILLGLLRADREGNWLLHLFCIKEMIPFCFSLDKINYARYLPFYLAQISQLESVDKTIFEQFNKGQFSVQIQSKNPFSKIAVDQTLEETVNRDTQTAGGTRGFSLKPGTLCRYYMTAEHRASALREIRTALSYENSKLNHPDLHLPRIKKDEKAVYDLTDLLENNWTNPFATIPSDIVHLATGIRVSDDIATDLLSIRERGEKEYQKFKEERLEKGKDFHKPLKKLNLKMFSTNKRMKKKIGTKEAVLCSDRRLFGTMILIAENRQLNMREVFSHPLGPIPWSLANADGAMRKTNKAKLANRLQSTVSTTDTWPKLAASIIDMMSIIHKVNGENLTFDELSKTVLEKALNYGGSSRRIDLVFDIYFGNSIKNAERDRRGSSEGLSILDIKDGHKIKNWKRLLMNGDSKNKLNLYLVDSWKHASKRSLLGNRTIFATYGTKCIEISSAEYKECEELICNHEEADTRILLHMKHAAVTFSSVVCVAEDTDIFVLCMALNKSIDSDCFVKNQNKLISVKAVAETLDPKVLDSLIGFHSFTGCDTVSAFAGLGKLKALNILQKNIKYQDAFSNLGVTWILSEDIFKVLEEFTCRLYSKNTKSDKVNDLRYQMFSSKKASPDSGQLPPCEDCLRQHVLRANYQAAVWRRSLENNPEIPKPTDGHGWILDDEENIAIRWMTGAPAPEAVLELLSCKCLKECNAPSCDCISNNLKCTPACRCSNCNNIGENSIKPDSGSRWDDDPENDNYEEDEDEDDDDEDDDEDEDEDDDDDDNVLYSLK